MIGFFRAAYTVSNKFSIFVVSNDNPGLTFLLALVSARYVAQPSGSKKTLDLNIRCQNKLTKRYPRFMLNLGLTCANLPQSFCYIESRSWVFFPPLANLTASLYSSLMLKVLYFSNVVVFETTSLRSRNTFILETFLSLVVAVRLAGTSDAVLEHNHRPSITVPLW